MNMNVSNSASQLQIKQQDYESICNFLEQSCGIVLGDNKHYLVSSRLSCLIKKEKLGSLSELAGRLLRGQDRRLCAAVIDAMTTNETSWFRDAHPFDSLKDIILPGLVKRRVGNARIWSAACSSGQEPYSIAMSIEDFLRSRPGTLPGIQITATDISPAMLNIAKAAIFENSALMRGVSTPMRNLYFEAVEDRWRPKKMIRDHVTFKELNLLQSFAMLGAFDCIFCRNVLIYFSNTVKQDIISRLADALRPGGYLYLGGSESLTSVSDRFETLHCGRGLVYKLKP